VRRVNVRVGRVFDLFNCRTYLDVWAGFVSDRNTATALRRQVVLHHRLVLARSGLAWLAVLAGWSAQVSLLNTL